jgi:hypothetical protein
MKMIIAMMKVAKTAPSTRTITGDQPSQPTFKTYQDLMKVKPLKNPNDVADAFLSRDHDKIELLNNEYVTAFTSDYALYWWDYLSGYDVMFAQIGWNLTETQQIALIRGAAKQQNKDWGIFITWKYNKPPYLDNETEILSQMQTAYEAGTKYFVLFNYYEEKNNNPYGTLKPEHFQALQNFWNDVVKNPTSLKAQSKPTPCWSCPKATARACEPAKTKSVASSKHTTKPTSSES